MYPRLTVPVEAGNLMVLVPATAGTVNVTAPEVSPERTTELIYFPYKTTQRWPLGIVTVTPGLMVIGPTLSAFLPAVSV
jgi:hypothetical protein